MMSCGKKWVAGVMMLAAFPLLAERPVLRFGVLTDVHIHEDYKPSTDILEKELRWMDAQGVEAIVVPGDLANNGRVGELERFAATWEKVFPKGVASDGRRIERVLISGNHDLFKEEVPLAWERVLGEKFEKLFVKKVKSIPFVCIQHGRKGPGAATIDWYRDHAAELKDCPVFFHIQHAHPRQDTKERIGTCHGAFAVEESAVDDGWTARALANLPNAVVLSGHSHIPITDERSVWQGAFTSIGCGCSGVVCPTGTGKLRANGGMPGTKNRARLQPPVLTYGSDHPYTKPEDLKIPRETEPTMQDARAGLLIDVYADRLVIQRHSFYFDEPVGPDWIVPLPARGGSPFDPVVRAKKFPAPQFAPGARVTVERFEKAPAEAGDDWRGKKPCVRVSYPCACDPAGGRVFDYEVTAYEGDKKLFSRILFARGFHVPEPRSHFPGYCLLAPEDLPAGKNVTFKVTPRNEFGVAGRAIGEK